MTNFQTQKANKPRIHVLADQLMTSDYKKEFTDFLDYLQQQKIVFTWYATNAYALNFRSKRVALMSLDENKFNIFIYTAQRDMFDSYLENQPQDIVDDFMASISIKCNGCTGCSPGKTFAVLGKSFKHVCFGGRGTHGYNFAAPGKNQIETIKKYVCIRQEYITKMLALGIHPGTAK